MIRLLCSLLVALVAGVALPGWNSCYSVSVVVNGTKRATISVPAGDIMGINYDSQAGTLHLLSIKPIEWHPSRTYQRQDTQFFTPLRRGTYKLSWRSGACRSEITVR